MVLGPMSSSLAATFLLFLSKIGAESFILLNFLFFPL